MTVPAHKPVFWNANWIAYLTLAGLALYALSAYQGVHGWLIAVLLGSIVALFQLSLPQPKRRRSSLVLFAAEAILAGTILVVGKAATPFPVVFFVLSVQSVGLFPYRISQAWIGAFALATAVIFLAYLPWPEAIVSAVVFGTGYWFWSTLARLSIQADVARRESQALLAQLQEAHRLLREQSVRDPLTGLFNRRYLEETLTRETARSQRNGQPVSLMVIDIDHFKHLNDAHGHLAGDQVLKSLGAFLQGGCRADDIACRFGGEEFIVVLPGMGTEAAAQRAEEWRGQAAHLEVPWDGEPLRVTISLGVATFPCHAESGEALIARADEALYQAKRTGRNRAVVCQAAPASAGVGDN